MLHHRSIVVVCLVCALCFCGVTGQMLWELRRQAWNNSMRGAENLLTAVAQDIERNIEIFDLSLQASVDGMKLPSVETLSPALRQAVLFDRAASARYLGSSLVLDENGWITDDAISVPPHIGQLAERKYFTVHRDNPDLGLFISAPYRRHLTSDGDLVIAFSRRISKPDGSFGGVAVSTLRLEYFKVLFDRLSLGPKGAVTLIRRDGTVMMRAPFDESLIGAKVPDIAMKRLLGADHGQFAGTAALDGIKRIVNFMHVGDKSLVLTVALSEADIFAEWNSRAAVIAGVLATMCVAMGGLGLLFSVELGLRFRAEAEMRESEAQLRLLANNASDVIIRLDAAMTRRFVSPSCRKVMGYEPHELLGRPIRGIIHPEDWPIILACADAVRQGEGHPAVDYRIRHRDGSYVWVEGQYSYVAADGGFTVVLRDANRRKESERELFEVHAELTRIAITDGLTGLANRRRFDEAIIQEWRRAAREELPLTLLLLDVDRFKLYNDRYGHQEGDACLIAIAQAVAGCARRPADLVARYGGEEIVIVLPGTDEEYAAVVAERVRLAVLGLDITHDDNREHGGIVTTSIGAATVIPCMRQPGQRAETEIKALIADADQALYLAKKQGRNQVVMHRELASIAG